MKVIVAIDDRNGMMFNHRRLSQDSLLIKDIMELSDGHLWVNTFSSSLFEEDVFVDDDFLNQAQDDDYCFVENVSIDSYLSSIDELIVYHWNRRYPADMFFDVDLNQWDCFEQCEFQGTSHDKILRERYRKKS